MISDCMTVKCPICGRPYKIWSTMYGDQSACPRCRKEAERADSDRPDTYEEYRRRQRYFYGDGRMHLLDPNHTFYHVKQAPSTTDIENEINFYKDWGAFS